MPTATTRRRFLLQTSSLVATSGLQPSAHSATAGDTLFGGGRFREAADGQDKFVLARVTPATSTLRQAAASFFPHGLAFADASRKRAFAFEKIGPGAALFDLESMQQVTAIAPVQGRLFYGHGVCSLDGKLLYSTETTPEGEGAIGVRETASLRYVGDFPTFGSHPHECHLLERGTVLAVTNGGGSQASGKRASICYIDVRSQKLLERIEMPDDRFNAGHMFPLARHDAVLVSAPRRNLGDDHLGAISTRLANGPMEVLSQPPNVVANMFGEALSVLALPASDLFVVTHPTPGMVTFWKISTRQLVNRLNLPRARGVAATRDGKGIWVSFGPRAELVEVRIDNFQPGPVVSGTFLTGSHLFPV